MTTPGEKTRTVRLAIGGMSCVNCSNSIESYLSASEGVVSVSVNFSAGSGSVEYDPGRISPAEIVSLVAEIGFTAEVAARRGAGVPAAAGIGRRDVAVAFAFAVPVFVLNMFLCDRPYAAPLMLALSLPVVFYSGRLIHKKALITLARRLPLTMDALVSASSLSSFALSVYLYVFRGSMDLYFDSATSIIAIILAGKAVEERIRDRARGNVTGIVEGMPETATVVRDGTESSVPLRSVAAGETIVIKPHQRIPVDGVLERSEGFVDKSVISGESSPEFVRAGSEVFAGSMNMESVLFVRASSSGEDSYISRIGELIENAMTKKAALQKTADMISAVFVPAVFFLAAATLAFHYFAARNFEAALLRAISVVAIACPCALGLALPAAFLFGANSGAKRGILYADPDALSEFGKVNTLIFDKTGTLTENRLFVENVSFAPEAAGDSDTVLALAGSLERYSEHPIARAVGEYLASRKVAFDLPVTDFRLAGGAGLEGVCGGRRVRIGNANFAGGGWEAPAAEAVATEGQVAFFVSLDGRPAARFGLSEKLAEGAGETVAALTKKGVEVFLLTGDREAPALRAARAVGIPPENVRHSVKPHEKAGFLDEIKKARPGRVVAMVGDGVNDALALARADVGIATADAASIARVSAAAILTRGGLKNVAFAIEFGARMKRIINQNFFWAFFYNAVLVPSAMAGKLNPMQAALAMALSSLFVVMNSTRLGRN